MDLYLLVMQGQGDTHVKLVTKPIWDWVFSGLEDGRPDGKHGWYDHATPLSVQSSLGDYAFVTSGSLDNDRALQAAGADVPYDEYGDSDEPELARAWATKNGHHIVNTWHGCIY